MPGDIFDAVKAAVKALTPLTPEEQQRALRWIADQLGIQTPDTGGAGTGGTGNPGSGAGAAARTDGTPPTAKKFLLDKKAKSQVEQVTVLGYYLTHFMGTPHFKTPALTDLNRDAGGPRISNAVRDVGNATTRGYLLAAGAGQKKLSALGELVVEALPDRAAVKAVLANQKTRRRRPPAKKSAKRTKKS